MYNILKDGATLCWPGKLHTNTSMLECMPIYCKTDLQANGVHL